MARIVPKFGGTSVGDIDRIRNAARQVQAEVDRGNEVAVVVVPRGDVRYYTVRIRTADEEQLASRAAALREAGFSPVRVRD